MAMPMAMLRTATLMEIGPMATLTATRLMGIVNKRSSRPTVSAEVVEYKNDRRLKTELEEEEKEKDDSQD